MKATANGPLKPTAAEPRGLTKRELDRWTRTCAAAARALALDAQVPAHATLRDMLAGLDAMLTEITKARKVTAILARPAKKAVA